MKIRTGFVSNSSSSSFLICGSNIIELLKNDLDTEDKENFTFGFAKYSVSIAECNKEILEQCLQYSNQKLIQEAITQKLYRAADLYFQFYKHYSGIEKCCCDVYYHTFGLIKECNLYSKFYKGTIWNLSNNLKKYIKEDCEKQKGSDYYELNYEDEKISKELTRLSKNIYKKFIKKYKEIYIVSFGDNHGECSGDLGAYIEERYLGEKIINSELKSNFEIYRIEDR